MQKSYLIGIRKENEDILVGITLVINRSSLVKKNKKERKRIVFFLA